MGQAARIVMEGL